MAGSTNTEAIVSEIAPVASSSAEKAVSYMNTLAIVVSHFANASGSHVCMKRGDK